MSESCSNSDERCLSRTKICSQGHLHLALQEPFWAIKEHIFASQPSILSLRSTMFTTRNHRPTVLNQISKLTFRIGRSSIPIRRIMTLGWTVHYWLIETLTKHQLVSLRAEYHLPLQLQYQVYWAVKKLNFWPQSRQGRMISASGRNGRVSSWSLWKLQNIWGKDVGLTW